MVTLPKEFVATKYPGYFWNIQNEQLYSVKVTGTLKPLAKQLPNQFNHFVAGYKISVRGNKRTLALDYLKTLKPKTTVYPIFLEQMEIQ